MEYVPHRRFDSFVAAKADAASSAQSSAQGGKVGKRALILATVDELMQIRRTCGFIIENVFAEDIAARASWKSAAHVENPPKKKKPPEGEGNGDGEDDPPTP